MSVEKEIGFWDGFWMAMWCVLIIFGLCKFMGDITDMRDRIESLEWELEWEVDYSIDYLDRSNERLWKRVKIIEESLEL